eukprot:5106610-Amphidinium_carterae.1
MQPESCASCLCYGLSCVDTLVERSPLTKSKCAHWTWGGKPFSCRVSPLVSEAWRQDKRKNIEEQNELKLESVRKPRE